MHDLVPELLRLGVGAVDFVGVDGGRDDRRLLKISESTGALASRVTSCRFAPVSWGVYLATHPMLNSSVLSPTRSVEKLFADSMSATRRFATMLVACTLSPI